MSNYQAPAYHPETGALQEAMFMDDYFGKHRYGVQFADGRVFPAEDVKVPKRAATNSPLEAVTPSPER